MAKRFRLTIRARLTLGYAALFVLSGGLLLLGINLFMRFWPTWALPAAIQLPAESLAAPSLPAETLPAELPAELPELIVIDRLEGFSPVEIQTTGDIFTTLLGASLIALLVIAVLGALAAWFLSGRILAPLHTINAAARRATPSRLDQRVGLTGPRDELTELSDTLDEMLGRIEQAYAAQQLFAANASHELRTPLATEKAMIDMVLDGPEASAAELRAVVTKLRAVNARNIELVTALLQLTRSRVAGADGAIEASGGDRGGGQPEAVDAGPILAAVLAEVRPAAEARGMTLSASVAPALVRAQPALLRQLAENLVQNAVRHGEAGGDLDVSLAAAAGWAVLRVSNAAAELSPDTLARLHEPFVRAGGRVRAGQGSGLGLAIAQAIAASCSGSLSLEQDPSGRFVAEARIPLAGP